MAEHPDPEEFEICRPLGSGGMADVYLARRLSGERELVALKRIRTAFEKHEHRLAEFEREARIGSLLRHEHVVGLRSFGEDALGPYLALEYVHGRSAAALLRALNAAGNRLPLDALARLLLDVTLGLQYAHALADEQGRPNPVIHRDVTPDNILVSYDGVAKLADFGIAKLSEATSITRTGHTKGKLAFMAPELFEGEDANEASDFFALAATAYKLACGVAAFRGKTDAEVVRAVLSARPPRAGLLREDLPRELGHWLDGSLEQDRRRRPQGGTGLREILESLCPDEAAARASLARCLREALPEELQVEEPWRRPASLRQTREVQRPGHGRGLRRAALAAGVSVTFLLGAVGVRALTVHRAGPALAVASVAPPVAAPNPVSPPPTVLTRASVPTRDADAPRPRHPRPSHSTLRVMVQPWAHVFLDGADLGPTPIAAIMVRPGPHSLILVNERLQYRRTFEVLVRAGEERVLKVPIPLAPAASR